MRRLSLFGLCLAALMLCVSCHRLDMDRIPPMPVHITFQTQAQWTIYGTPSALDHRSFIVEERKPADFPWTASTFTGYGGVLLVGNVLGDPQAFDLACPVECRQSVRVFINADLEAECPVCGSRYDVFSLGGHPIGGPAARDGYGLRPYRVGPGRTDFMTVSY